nr:hypothetical protein [Tanacetum cinerariifolium]
KAIEKGAGPNWLFDIDSLTKSMNYVLVDTGTISTNLSGTKDATSQEVKKDVSSLRYIALPNWSRDALLEFSSTDHMETLTVESPIPTVSSLVLTAYSTNSQEPSSDARLISKRVANQEETPSLDNILSLTNWFEDILGGTTNSDESNGEEADISNMETVITASPTPTLRIHKDHPKSQIIVPVDTPIQTRNKSKEVRTIGTKWVLKNKKDERWSVIRNKAKLVAQGHTQEERIDYNEVFAPVERIEAIILFLAYASFMGFTVYQMDVKSAFLYGTIDEEVYVMQPLGFQDLEFPVKVYKVEKAMYGLHQAPRAWYGTLSKYLLNNGFQRGDILKKFGYSDVRSSNTPMDKENPWGKDGTRKDCQPTNEDYCYEQNSCYNSNSFGSDHCQPSKYTADHPIFDAHNDFLKTQNELLTSQNTIMEQMTQLTSMCELVCQIVQKKQEEKRIEEEQAASARYWKIPALIKSSVENLIPIPSEFGGIPDTMCDMHLENNHTPLEAKDHVEIVINSNDDISSSDDDSLHEENIDKKGGKPNDRPSQNLDNWSCGYSNSNQEQVQRVEPKKISDALQDPSWVEAMQEELLQFKIQNVWTLVYCPKGVRPIGTKWVLKNKKDVRGIVIRNKARLVAQRNIQEEGIDYDEDPNFPAKVFKVEKAMYGLHQAPRAWYCTLSKYLLTNGFQRGTIDQTLFTIRQRGNFILIQVYVDDIIFGSSNAQLCKEFKAIMHEKFQMSAMGELDFFLGLSSNTPMDKENPWGKDRTGKDVDLNLYRSMIGSLMYLTTSRPDIMFAVYACARHQVTPKECHLYAGKKIFRYLKGHPKLGLWYPKESPFDLVAYSDSDYGGATQDRKSTTGVC